MPAADLQQPLMPSLLSRLLDPESMRGASQARFGVQTIIDSVRFDMEDLFNTRQSGVEVPNKYEQVQNSIVTYGLPDLTYFDINNDSECERVCGLIVELINRFEPRLRGVNVSVVTDAGASDRQVRFHIESLLAVDPAPEVSFDTVVELSTGKTSVETKTVSA